MTLEEYKKTKGGQTALKKIKKFFSKFLICGIIVLAVMIVCNLSNSTKALIKKELFETNFDFSKVNQLYNKLFDNKDTKNVALVDNLSISNYKEYLDGISVNMNQGESVSNIESGIVVYIGEKEGYGNTIIIQQSDGVDAWYGNVENIGANLYDYVNKGTIIATSKENMYLVFQKNGEFLDYKEYIE